MPYRSGQSSSGLKWGAAEKAQVCDAEERTGVHPAEVRASANAKIMEPDDVDLKMPLGQKIDLCRGSSRRAVAMIIPVMTMGEGTRCALPRAVVVAGASEGAPWH